jgi:ABC-type polysaccharide/polyol phosphate transport system ATPase subunit
MKVIELDNVSLDYELESDDSYSLKNAILNFYLKSQAPKRKYFRALNNITLDINAGEKIGILGHNGAGKTTFLRLISGIFYPTAGAIKIHKKVSPILDFGTGFEQHLTGIENIALRLMLLGLSYKEAQDKIPEIVEFAEIGKFIHQPVRTYSSGMFLRLAFATSTAIHPDILVADEIIGTGDINFAQKAKRRIEEFLSRDCTMILSSHDMELVKNFCNRIIWLDKGVVRADGNVDDVLNQYMLQY